MSNIIDFETAKKRIQTNQSEELLEILDEMESWDPNAALGIPLGNGWDRGESASTFENIPVSPIQQSPVLQIRAQLYISSNQAGTVLQWSFHAG